MSCRLLSLVTCFSIATLLTGELRSQTQNFEPRAALEFDAKAILTEVDELVSEHFYREDFQPAAWKEDTQVARKRALAAKSHEEFAEAINAILKQLDASHTYYYSRYNPRRYQLVGVFEQLFADQPKEFFCYRGIGVLTKFEQSSGYHRVVAVYDGFPADRAGVAYGDLIRSVDSNEFEPIRSFQKKSGQVRVELTRQGKNLVRQIPVVELDGRTMFEAALTQSAKVLKRNGKAIAYVHVWSYAGPKYHELVKEQILSGDLADCDALILDLRDGWGGADLRYIDLFRKPAARVSFQLRGSPPSEYKSVWGKPVVLLTNERTTSGKELFSYAFKKLSLGKIVGANTAGAVLGGRCFKLSNDDMLYLAVLDVRVDGQPLEGSGVTPDVAIEREFEDSSRVDSQLEEAINVLLKGG